jgi:hypothetical protein
MIIDRHIHTEIRPHPKKNIMHITIYVGSSLALA